MSKNPSQALIPAGVIEHRIYLLRNHKVMLDHDLAKPKSALSKTGSYKRG